MKVQDILTAMRGHAFDRSFMSGIRHMYNARPEDYSEIESAFEAGREAIAGIMSENQRMVIEKLEGIYEARRSYAAEYSFKCGMYGAFQQNFGCANHPDGGFQVLVLNDLFLVPRMQRHKYYYKLIESGHQIEGAFSNALPEEFQEHWISVLCALQQRVYSAAVDGFYCGYRAAYDLMGVINPLVKVENMDKILTTEYYLGFIKPYSETERLSEASAA